MKLKLTESQYQSLLIYINEARQAPVPINLSGFFNKNKKTAYFTIVKLIQKTKDESEYLFFYDKENGYNIIKDENQGTVTRGCSTYANLDTMIYGNEFTLTFSSCNNKTLKINDVVGIRLFDENKNKLDEMKFDNPSTEDSENLADRYNDELKSLSNGDEVFFDTLKKQYDGNVLNKSSDKMEIELHEHGKDNSILLYVNLDNDGFYDENDKIYFQSTKKNTKKDTESEFKIQVKNFSSSNSTKQREPEVNDPDNQQIDEPEETPEDDFEKPNATNWPSPEDEEELRAKAKAAYDEIMKSTDIQKAFYRKPTFWNLFMAELKGEKAPGKGILPTIQMVGDLKSNKIDIKLKGDFIEGKQVIFKPYGSNIVIYDNNDENDDLKTFTQDTPYMSKVRPFDIEDNTRFLDNNAYNNGFVIELISPTDKENVYLCNVSHSRSRNHKTIEGTATNQYIYLDPNSKGYKPLPKQNNP